MTILTEVLSPFLIVMIVFAAFVAIFLIVFVIETIINHFYKKFVLEHSDALKELAKINSNYQFKDVPNFDMKHAYDNENMYDDISCEDYLIYELVFYQTPIFNAIKGASYNKDLFNAYKNEINERCDLEKFDTSELPRSKKRLTKIRKKLFLKEMHYPTTVFNLSVKLILTNINGAYKTSKIRTFDSVEILDLIMGVNDKRGSYYRNQYIWNSICRVERGKVTNKMRFAVYRRDGYRCRRCGRRTDDLEIDHIYPIAKGGKSTFDNLQTLCHRCNVRKGSNIYY